MPELPTEFDCVGSSGYPIVVVVVERKRETQYTGPGHGIDAHVADRARLHARVYNCTTQLQGVLDNESFDLVPSHRRQELPLNGGNGNPTSGYEARERCAADRSICMIMHMRRDRPRIE